MAYLFGAGAADKIAVGTNVTLWTTKVSVYARGTLTSSDTSAREILTWVTAGVFDWQLFLEYGTGGTNQVQFGYRSTTPSYHIATWTSGFTAGSLHTLVGVIDLTLGSANVALYADTDATAKATANSTVAPYAATTPAVILGNHPDVTTQSLDGRLYEVGLWIQTALTGAQAAALGAGRAESVPPPTYYWPLLTDARAMMGGLDGVVSSATVVDHSGGNLYTAGPVLGRRIGRRR